MFMYKYENHFQTMYRDVGMAVPKTTESRCRAVCREDMLYKDYTINPIPTSFLYLKSF